ncbi:DUF1837 domain-containing protein [Aeromonas dhakensis]|uniref:HamA C-terminal domain-containing protein n=1 Tax=Aeromonas dhakensis TaxID=196024 RepID=UPI00191F8A5A|nr:DUF1837 domain-containing protein [Aeromonas dhakensis]MBL0532240.1 DUF1837 domain-containing protein [Aeromonas dhakensis]
MDSKTLEKLLTNVDSLINHTCHFTFDLTKPEGKSHKGICVNYTDLQERRSDFIRELKNTVCSWVYGKDKYNTLFKKELEKRGYDYQNASSHIDSLARDKFRKGIPQGQFGELLLFNFLQYFFKAPALLRKMPLTTSRGHERFGADAIHYKKNDEQHIIFIGESKAYKSNYKFKQAFSESLNSIINTYNTLQEELLLYTYDDFIDPKLQDIAEKLKDGELENVRYELVCLISYSELDNPHAECEEEIKRNIRDIILNRFSSLNLDITKDISRPLLQRVHYIVFPFWDFDGILEGFDS